MTYPTLTAIGTGRTLDIAALDAPLVCICFAQATQTGTEAIEAAVRARHATATDVLIAFVVDLHTVPGLFRGIADGILKSEYEKAVAGLPPDQTPYDDVIILPDWDGGFIGALGFERDVSAQHGVAVFGTDGTLLGTAQGDGAAEATLSLLTARRTEERT